MEGESQKELKPEVTNQEENYNELVSIGFDPILVSKALQLTNDKERAIELILKFQEEPIDMQPPVNEKVTGDKKEEEQKAQDALKINSMETLTFKMVLVVRQDLGMKVGKIAAQVGHAVLGAYKNILESDDIKDKESLFNWEECGQAKIVLKVNGKEELLAVSKKAKAAGLNTYIVCDAGRTQIEPGSLTVLAVGPGISSDIDKVTGHLKLM